MSRARLFLFAGMLFVAGPARAGDDVRAGLSFERDIRPILKAHCFGCHGEEGAPKGGLDARWRRGLASGGESGPAIVPGDHDASLLFRRVRDGEMPPGEKKLDRQAVDTIGRWIAAGAPTLRPEPDPATATGNDDGVTPEDREFWSFQPIRRPSIPSFDSANADSRRLRTPIDAFLYERLAAEGLSFAPDADRRTLLRRLSLDLVGLPPTPEEMERFLADERPDAYEWLVDQLLDSPHYGERWGRHWLDVAGYAESDGYSDADPVRPYAYKYRDYVIRALNEDLPLDRFLAEQLAGDELLGGATKELSAGQQRLLVATGLARMGVDGTATPAIEVEPVSNQVVADTIKIVTSAVLGLTVGCAQCHDHRYDPIPQRDYYRIRAIFEPAYDWKNWRTPNQRLVSLMTDEERRRGSAIEADAARVAAERAAKEREYLLAALEVELAKFPEDKRDPLRQAYLAATGSRTPDQTRLLAENPSVNITPGVLYQYNAKAAEELKKFDAQIGEIRAKKPVEDFVQALVEYPGPIPTTYLFHRGDHRQPKEAVEPGGLSVCSPAGERLAIAPKANAIPSTGRRLAFARWLASPANPLTARVLVNRIWMHHFGRGIVETPSDFGAMGSEPTYPELLDWLASELRSGGWRAKRLHRLIVNSTAYRQSSRGALDHEQATSRYGRFPVRRLDAEAVRDRVLATSGNLDLKMFGPSVPIQLDGVGQVIVGEGSSRRSLYLQVRRSQPVSFLATFDAPVMESNCDRRAVSTVAPQALMLMNSDFVLSQADRFAQRVEKEAGADPAAQARRAWELAFQRPPAADELDLATQFLTRPLDPATSPPSPAGEGPAAHELLASLCQTLFSANEFLYLD